MEYNIIENPSDQELYDAFVEEVNKKELSMKEIMDKLGLNTLKKAELHQLAKKMVMFLLVGIVGNKLKIISGTDITKCGV